jgi:hypothetical protein
MFIETTIFLEKRQLADIGVQQEYIESPAIIDTEQIEWSRPSTTDDGDIIEERCLIMLKSGDSIEIKTPYKEIRNILLYKKDEASKNWQQRIQPN